MAIGSGLGASFGMVSEVTRNTYVAPTTWFPGYFNIAKRFNRDPIVGAAAGRHAPPDEVMTNVWADVKWEGQVLTAGFGRFFQHMFGTTVTPAQQGGTTAYLQSHVWADNFGKYFTCQEGRPNRAGTANPITATGCKIKSLEFSCDMAGTVKMVAEIMGSAYTEAQGLSAPSYTLTREAFTGAEMDVKLGTFGSTAHVDGVRGYSIKFERPMQDSTDATYAGGLGLPSEQIYNDFGKVTGSLDLDLATKADFMDRASGHTATSLLIEHVKPVAIASTFFPTLRFRLPKIYFADEAFEVSDNGVVKASLGFEAFQDSNGFAFLDYMSTDVTIG